ncbi:hypothetical protein Q5692_39700, partial [Microcoleus sp. C2C3]|uniref:hypothetical protein n=1 Tax=unclassified Microcoleus TaxID=2642155 RepID=UPI002FD0C97E
FRENSNQGAVFDYIRQSIKLFIFQSLVFVVVVAGIGFLGQELSFPAFCVVVIAGVLLPSLVHYNLSRINAYKRKLYDN